MYDEFVIWQIYFRGTDYYSFTRLDYYDNFFLHLVSSNHPFILVSFNILSTFHLACFITSTNDTIHLEILFLMFYHIHIFLCLKVIICNPNIHTFYLMMVSNFWYRSCEPRNSAERNEFAAWFWFIRSKSHGLPSTTTISSKAANGVIELRKNSLGKGNLSSPCKMSRRWLGFKA